MAVLRCLALLCGLGLLPAAPSVAQNEQLVPTSGQDWNKSFSPQFPGVNWRKFATAEEAGWSSAKLAEVRKRSEAHGSAAVMIIYDGVVLSEWGETERRFMNHSMRKSILSALNGIAVERGEIDLEKSLGQLGIDDDTPLTPEEKTARISDLLKSRSAVFLPAAFESESMRERRPERGSHRPGSFWLYNNWGFNALATIYNRKTNGDMFKAFKARIADPLQMQDFDLRHTYYHLEPKYSRHPAYPFRMSARDLARFGLLFLNQGSWNGQQIVPPDWVRESTQAYSWPQGEERGYGYMWWRLKGALGEMGTYAASGSGGHRIFVVPRARLVMVHRSDTYAGKRVRTRHVRTILRDVLNARTGPAKANPELVERARQNEILKHAPPGRTEGETLAGIYVVGDTQLIVSHRHGGLEAYGPNSGHFHLLRIGRNEYVFEDSLYRLRFEADGRAPASSVIITFPHKKPLKLQRVS